MARKKKRRKKATRRSATAKRRRKSSTKRRTNAKRRRRKNPSVRARRKYSNKRASRTVNKSRRRHRRTYKKKARRRRRNIGGIGKLSMKNITRMLPALGWTALGWSLSGMIQAALGDQRINRMTTWDFLKGQPHRARAVVSGLTWIGLWFVIDKVDYLKKAERRDNLLRGAGLRFLWDAINGWMPITGYGAKVRTIFGLRRGGAPSRSRIQKQSYFDPMTGRSRTAYAGYEGGWGGDEDLMEAGYYGDDFGYGADPLGFHYENWQGANPTGMALAPGGHAVANPLGFHYENWQGANPTGMALAPGGGAHAVANPLQLSASHNPYRSAFRPAFR